MAEFNFDSVINQESGGHQFDRSGKPLTSSKGATGIAQIMPDTGPEAARDAGLPWDPVKFRNDANYNRALGEAYHAKLVKKYGGNVVLASAAYNGGPGRLDGLIAKYGQTGALAHMPRETRDYIRSVHGVHIAGAGDYSGGRATSGFGVPQMPPDKLIPTSGAGLTGGVLDSVLTVSGSHIVGNERFPVLDPFTAGPEMRTAAGDVNQNLGRQKDFLADFEQQLQGVQASRIARVQQTTEQKRQINDTITGETQSMIDRVAPIMSRRAQLAARLDKVSHMNPLLRDVMGIFDSNYDPEALTGKLRQTDEVLNVYGHDYEYITNLRQRLSDMVDRNSALGKDMEDVTLQNLDEKNTLISHTISAANSRFAFIGDQVNQSDNLIRSQLQATDRILTQMAPADIETALSRAQHSPTGTTVVDGVELSFGELRQRSMALKTQNMSFRSQQIALERGEADLADYHAGKWAENATESQIREAIDHDGNYHGMQIPMSILTQQLAIRTQATDMQAAHIAGGGQNMELVHDLTNLQGELNSVNVRMRSMFGGAEPPQMRDAALAISSGMQDVNRQFAEMKGKSPEVQNQIAAGLRQKVAALRDNFLKSINEAAASHAGGDKQAQSWISTFLRGGTLDANQSAEALYYYAQKGGLPTGMRSSPQAKAAFAAAQQAMRDVDASIAASGTKPTVDQRKAMVLNRIQQAAPKAYQSIAFNDLISVIPRVAQQNRDSLAAVSPEDFNAARRASETVPYEELARKLGTTPEIARQVMAGTYKGDKAQEYTNKVNNQNLRAQLISRQMSVFLDKLDDSPSGIRAGIVPSVSLAQFLQQPHMARLARQYEQTSRGASFGDFLGGGLGQDELPDRMDSWSRLVQNQVAQNRVAESQRGVAVRSKYTDFPYHRAGVIFSGMQGLNQNDITTLISGLQQVVPNKPDKINGPVSQALESAIKTHKFQDPQLERIRQIAAKQWDQVSNSIDRSMVAAYAPHF